MLPLSQWVVEEGYPNYKEAKRLNNLVTESSDREPYASKYKAREIFTKLTTVLQLYESNGIDNNMPESNVSIQEYLVVLNYELAINFLECEEISSGEEYLKKTLDVLKANPDSNVYSTLIISVYNQLAIISSNRTLFQNALDALKAAEEVYVVQQSKGKVPLHFDEVWNDSVTDLERESKFESSYTLTLYYLAQVYGSLGKPETSAKYCHETLARQIKSESYDGKDWSLNCAALSQYYVTQENYVLARYCLASAEFVHKKVLNQLQSVEVDESNRKQREEILKGRADICRCWAKYGLNLMKDSHRENMKSENISAVSEKEIVSFPGLDTSFGVDKITAEYAKDYVTAKGIFKFSMDCLREAQQFYQLDGYVTDFVEITQDMSQMYKFLAFYDDQYENRCKMHKRRIDMLNTILLELNPQHFLQTSRQLMFEIAEAYGEMAELKKAILEENPHKFNADSVKKMNFLIVQSIKFYARFVESYKHEGKLPDKFEDDDLRGVLLCYFCMARLNSKYTTNEKQTKLKYLLEEKRCYQFITSYYDRHDDVPNVFEEELPICREMLALFDAKMSKLNEV